MALISIPTIFICAFLAMASASIAMGVVWLYNRNERAAGYWSLCFTMGAIGPLFISLRSVFPDYIVYTVAIHSVLIFAAYMLFWAGFRAFNKQKVLWAPIVGVPAAWLVLYILWEPLRQDSYLGISVQAAITSAVTLLSAYTLYQNPMSRRLPMALPLIVFLTAHSAVNVAHIFFALSSPSPGIVVHITTAWWKFFMLESFIHTVFVAISCVILIKDRSEEHHRIASETDSLTGIFNRRAFVKATEARLETANESAALAIIDLDHFKRINDDYGHQAGDYALISFANLIKNNIPQDTIFGRLGGEEFALYLPQSADAPENVLEQLRQRAEELSIVYHGTRIQLTISIGLATIEKAGNGFDLLVAAADCALYLAKDEGRNRLVTFTPSQRLRKITEKDGEKRIGLADERISRKSARPTRAQA